MIRIPITSTFVERFWITGFDRSRDIMFRTLADWDKTDLTGRIISLSRAVRRVATDKPFSGSTLFDAAASQFMEGSLGMSLGLIASLVTRHIICSVTFSH